MSEIRVTSVVGENGGDRVGLTTGLTVGPLTGTTGIGATITHQGHAQFAGVCTATSFVGNGANLTSLPAATTDNLTLQAYGSFDLASGATSFSNGTQMGPFDTVGTLVGITKATANGVANSRFTLPSAGVYLIQAKMYAAGNANPATFGFNIYKNNSVISYSFVDTAGFVGSNGDYIHFNHYIGEFSANDFIDLRAGGSVSGWSDVEGNNRLTICKIGTL